MSILGLSVFLIVGQYFQGAWHFNREDIVQGQWWKVLSGNYTHSNIPHLLLNVSGLWVLGLLFIDNFKAKLFIFSAAFLTVVVGLGLYFFNPELNYYYGFSGVLYGLYFVAAVSAILAKDVFTGLSIVCLVGAKIIWDSITGGNQSSADLIGVPVANDAHLYGFTGALLITGVLLLKKRFPNKQSSI